MLSDTYALKVEVEHAYAHIIEALSHDIRFWQETAESSAKIKAELEAPAGKLVAHRDNSNWDAAIAHANERRQHAETARDIWIARRKRAIDLLNAAVAPATGQAGEAPPDSSAP